MEEYSGLLELASDKYKYSAYMHGASAFAQLASGYTNYSALNTDAYSLRVQANNIELQAQEKANMLREQFLQSLGAYQLNAVQRGVSLSSGSVRDNMESSAMGLGNDISKIKKNAMFEANALRAKASINKGLAKSAMWSVLGGTMSSLGNAFMAYDMSSKLATKAENAGKQVYGNISNVGPFMK